MAPKTQRNTLDCLVYICVAVACLSAQTTTAFAGTDSDDIYIDSVYSWGIWELDPEPTSALQVSANTAMNDRSRQLLFRPNDNAAYTPRSIPVPSVQPPPPQPLRSPLPIIGVSGSGPITPGMVPNPPNLR